MMKPHFQSKLPKKVLFIVILMVLCGITLAALAILTPSSYQVYSSETDPNVIGGAPLIYWYPQQDQYSVKNTTGSFEIKAYIVSSLKFYLFYVVQTGQPENQPQIFQLSAFSSTDLGFTPLPKPGDSSITPIPSPSPDLKKATPLLITSNRVISSFDKIDIRLATIDVPDQPQQRITFQVSLPGQSGANLELTPVQQLDAIRDSQTVTGATGLPDHSDSPAYTDVRVEFPIFGGDNNQMGILKISGSSSVTPPLLFQMDVQGNLKPFSQTGCATVFPPHPTNPPPKNNGPVTATIAIPAPCKGNS